MEKRQRRGGSSLSHHVNPNERRNGFWGSNAGEYHAIITAVRISQVWGSGYLAAGYNTKCYKNKSHIICSNYNIYT
jgi:hypothetical protein